MTASFANRLLAWWDAHGRKDMPWQRQRTPYRIWVAEVILQQTRVATAAPYFERFLARFPDVRSLAAADLDEVLHLWSGLGYYARARNLHRAARLLEQHHGGDLPRSRDAIEALPGVGRSTAAAIVAQAHGERAAILDGNVKRVLARHHRVPGPVDSAATLNALWEFAESHTPEVRVADYTQAVMNLGATLCRRLRPMCEKCPVAGTCAANLAGDAERFPERRGGGRAARRIERRRFFVLIDEQGACYVERRPETGVWGSLFSPPDRPRHESVHHFLASLGAAPEAVLAAQEGATFRHAFSHYDLDVTPVYVRLRSRPDQLSEVREGGRDCAWIQHGRHRLGLSAVAARLLRAAAGAAGSVRTPAERRRDSRSCDVH